MILEATSVEAASGASSCVTSVVMESAPFSDFISSNSGVVEAGSSMGAES